MADIIVIDDEEQILRLLELILTREGHIVRLARDGNEGLNLQKDAAADLVITDLIMPNKEGIETILELRKNYPDTKVIAISGGGRIDSENYLQIAQWCGASKIFSKPIDRMELLSAVKELTAENHSDGNNDG